LNARLRLAAAVLVAAVLAGCAITTLHRWQWGYDDAFVSYRYAQNLVEGHGLVFNAGERVEGYSNLLYVVSIAAALLVVPSHDIYFASVALNSVLLALALVLYMAAVARRLDSGRALAAGLFFGLSPLLWYAAWTGMETPLVLLLFVWVWSLVPRIEGGEERLAPWLGGALALTILARADGFVTAFIVLSYLALKLAPARRWRTLGVAAGMAGGTLALHVAWRLAYYGLPLPNTYYAKVAGTLSQRLAYAGKLILVLDALEPYLAVIALCGLAAGLRFLGELGRGSLARAIVGIPFDLYLALAWLAYWFTVGGDIFGMRMLLVLLPIGFYLLLEHVGPYLWSHSAWPRHATALFFAGLIALPFHTLDYADDRTSYDPWDTLGVFLGLRYDDALLAVDGAGKIPFYSRLPTVDMYGLNDTTIARRVVPFVAPGHSKYDTAYVFSREPELIAAWIKRPLDLDLGLLEKHYRPRGYRLTYMLHTPHPGPYDPATPQVIQVDGMTRREQLARWRAGYHYGVLVRQASGSGR